MPVGTLIRGTVLCSHSPGISWRGCCLPAAARSQRSSAKGVRALLGDSKGSALSLADRGVNRAVNRAVNRGGTAHLTGRSFAKHPTCPSCFNQLLGGVPRETGAADVVEFGAPREGLSAQGLLL